MPTTAVKASAVSCRVGLKDRRDIAVAGLGTRVTAVIAAEHIGRQRTHPFAASPALRALVLPGVVMEKILVRAVMTFEWRRHSWSFDH